MPGAARPTQPNSRSRAVLPAGCYRRPRRTSRLPLVAFSVIRAHPLSPAGGWPPGAPEGVGRVGPGEWCRVFGVSALAMDKNNTESPAVARPGRVPD